MKFSLHITALLTAGAVLFPTSTVHGADPDRVVIGALLPVTGNASYIGSAEKETLSWLVEQYNRGAGKGRKKLKLLLYDTGGVPDRAVKLARKLIETDHAAVVIGPGVSGESLAVKEIFARAEIPLISLASSHKIVDPVDPWIFKLAQSDSLAVERLYAYLNNRKIRRAALLTASDAFGASGREELRRLAQAHRIDVRADEVMAGKSSEIAAQLRRIRKSGAEAVIIWGAGPQPADFTRRVRRAGMKQLLLQSHGSASGEFIRFAGSAANGVVLPAGKLVVASSLSPDDPQRRVLHEFARGYRRRYGREASTFGGHAWDAFHLLKPSLLAGRIQPRQLRDDLEARRNYTGVTGIYNFSPTDHAGLTRRAFVTVTIKRGKFELVP